MRQSRSSERSSSLNTVQQAFCIKITKQITNYSTARFFREPVDPIRDGAENYNEIIKKPMDLGTVMQNLHDGKYNSIDKWKDDMNLIWKNACTYNNQMSPLYAIAKDLGEVFKRKTDAIPKSEIEEWSMKMKKSHAKILKLMSCKPDGDLKPSPSASLVPKIGHTPKILLRQRSSNPPSQPNPNPAPENYQYQNPQNQQYYQQSQQSYQQNQQNYQQQPKPPQSQPPQQQQQRSPPVFQPQQQSQPSSGFPSTYGGLQPSYGYQQQYQY